MKMKRVFKCNFCFDSREIWDGKAKEYIPCGKCSDQRQPFRSGVIGNTIDLRQLQNNVLETMQRMAEQPGRPLNVGVDTRRYTGWLFTGGTLFNYLVGTQGVTSVKRLVVRIVEDSYYLCSPDQPVVFKLDPTLRIILGGRGDRTLINVSTLRVNRLPLGVDIVSKESPQQEIGIFFNSIGMPYYYNNPEAAITISNDNLLTLITEGYDPRTSLFSLYVNQRLDLNDRQAMEQNPVEEIPFVDTVFRAQDVVIEGEDADDLPDLEWEEED